MGAFCTNCGTKAEENPNFCTRCGKKLVNDSIQKTPAIVGPETQKQTRAIAVVLVALILVTMSFGWLNTSPDDAFMQDMPHDLLGLFGGGLLQGGVTIHSLANTTKALRSALNTIEREIREIGGRGAAREFRQETAPIRSAATTVSVLRFFNVLSVVSLLIFLYLMLKVNKRAATVGKIGVGLAFLTALAFLVATVRVRGQLDLVFDDTFWFSGLESVDLVRIRATIWVYVSLGLSFSAFWLIVSRKNTLFNEGKER